MVETEALKTLTLEDIRQFYRDFIAPDAPKRRKMATFVEPAVDAADAAVEITTKEKPVKKVGGKNYFLSVDFFYQRYSKRR